MKAEKYSPDRLNALSDGVIAIALTLLVLGIDIPADHEFDKEGLLSFLIKLEPEFVAYLTSFIIITIYWVMHNRIFGVLKFVNRTIIVLNIIFLFSISLAPFISKLKTLYRYDSIAVAIYALVHIITGLILFITWKYLMSHSELLNSSIDDSKNKSVSFKILIIPVVSIIAVLLAIINVHLGTYFFILIPIFYAIIALRER